MQFLKLPFDTLGLWSLPKRQTCNELQAVDPGRIKHRALIGESIYFDGTFSPRFEVGSPSHRRNKIIFPPQLLPVNEMLKLHQELESRREKGCLVLSCETNLLRSLFWFFLWCGVLRSFANATTRWEQQFTIILCFCCQAKLLGTVFPLPRP